MVKMVSVRVYSPKSAGPSQRLNTMFKRNPEPRVTIWLTNTQLMSNANLVDSFMGCRVRSMAVSGILPVFIVFF
ncbi:MAG TPA: hypothetical protein PLD13_12355 [Methanoculleus sp.]|nr:hypothetical protein [Methanoculleus sp.]